MTLFFLYVVSVALMTFFAPGCQAGCRFADSANRLKCNRAYPCGNCVKKGDARSCTYATPGTRKKNSSSHGFSTSPDDMQNRIDRLEGLVLSLMTNGAQSAGRAAANAALSARASTGCADAPHELDAEDDDMIKEEVEDGESETDQVARSFGVMKVDNNKSMYIGEAHWAAILSDVSTSLSCYGLTLSLE